MVKHHLGPYEVYKCDKYNLWWTICGVLHCLNIYWKKRKNTKCRNEEWKMKYPPRRSSFWNIKSFNKMSTNFEYDSSTLNNLFHFLFKNKNSFSERIMLFYIWNHIPNSWTYNFFIMFHFRRVAMINYYSSVNIEDTVFQFFSFTHTLNNSCYWHVKSYWEAITTLWSEFHQCSSPSAILMFGESQIKFFKLTWFLFFFSFLFYFI